MRVKYLLLILLVSMPAFAIDLDKALGRLEEKTKSKVDQKVGDLKGEAQKVIDKANAEIDRAKEEIDQAKAEIDKVKAKVNGYIEDAERYKAQIEKYLGWLNTIKEWAAWISAMIGSVMVMILIILYRFYARFKNLSRAMTNIANYKEIVKRIEALESKSL